MRRSWAGSLSTWAMLIKHIYEVDPLECGRCGGEMEIISFIERGQRPVIERILRGHQSGADQRFASVPVGGLWEGPMIRTRANQRGPASSSERDPSEPHELQLVLEERVSVSLRGPPRSLPPLPSMNTREAHGRYRYAIMYTETGQYWAFVGGGGGATRQKTGHI